MRTTHPIALVTVAMTVALSTTIGTVAPVATAAPPSGGPNPTQLVTGLEGGSGSTDRPRWCAVRHRRRSRQDLARRSEDRGRHDVRQRSADGRSVGIGGAIDVAFIGKTAYVLVTLVGPDVGGSDVVGIYRVDGPDSFTVVADIGAFSVANPPTTPFDVPTGVQYALETYRGGFLVTDGHHNRVLRVTLDGEVTELIAFDNIVPTGLAVRATRCTWPRPAPSPTCPRTARSCRSGRSRPPPRRWPPAPACSSTWSSAAVARSTPSRRASSVGGPAGSPALPNTGAS